MNQTLENKVAIVTGAGGETGSAIALALTKAGARVVVNDINPDRVARVVTKGTMEGSEVIGITADISNRFQCVNLIESTREKWGRLDILVNNASVKPASPILKMDEWAWQRSFDVNLKGAFFMSQLVGRVMADENQDRGGTIVNIGAAAAVPSAGRSAYAASKAGLTAFTYECAREFASKGIRVYLVEPGGVNVRQDVSGKESGATGDSAQVTAGEVLRLCSNPALNNN